MCDDLQSPVTVTRYIHYVAKIRDIIYLTSTVVLVVGFWVIFLSSHCQATHHISHIVITDAD